MEMITNIAGYAAAVCMVCGYLPQAVHTIRTRETDGIAMPTFILMMSGSIFFVVQGLLLGNVPLVLTNAITGLCSAIVSGIKVSNDLKRRR